MNCLRVSQAPERAPTIAAWPQLADARPTPSATRCCMPYSFLTERQSCPVPSHSLARALAAPEQIRHGRRAPSSHATAAPSLTALLRLHRASLRIRRITTPLLRPFFGHRGRRSAVAASSGGLQPLASVAGRLWALSIGAVPLCGLTQAPFGRGTAARRRGGAPPARVAVPGHPLLCFPTRGFVLEFEKREGPFCRTCDSCE